MVDDMPPRAPGGGRGILALLVLAVLGAALALWAWQRNPPGAPDPAATAVPETVPGGDMER